MCELPLRDFCNGEAHEIFGTFASAILFKLRALAYHGKGQAVLIARTRQGRLGQGIARAIASADGWQGARPIRAHALENGGACFRGGLSKRPCKIRLSPRSQGSARGPSPAPQRKERSGSAQPPRALKPSASTDDLEALGACPAKPVVLRPCAHADARPAHVAR